MDGASHIVSLLSLPFLCKANLEGRAGDDRDIMVREGRVGARKGERGHRVR